MASFFAHRGGHYLVLTLAALGVVYGDIGTSPLYSLQTVFSADHNAVEASRGEWPQALDVFRQSPTAAKLRAFERETERASVIAALVRPRVQSLRFKLLRDPGEKTTLGSGGWLRPNARSRRRPTRGTGGWRCARVGSSAPIPLPSALR